MRLALALLVAFLALPAAAAQAGLAGSSQIDGSDVVFSADPGEANRLTVTGQGSDTVVFEDAGAPIRAGRNCTQLAADRVSCDVRFGFVVVELEDGDDEVTTAGQFGSTGETLVFLDGDQGADTLRGEAGRTRLTGGTGTDRLIGGPATVGIDGIDLVRRSQVSGMPDHNRERDEITCAGPPPGPEPLIVRVDTNDVTDGECGQRNVFLEEFVLIEGTAAADQLFAGAEPSRVFGLGGDDRIFGSGEEDRVDGGPGNDSLVGIGFLLGGSGDDRLDAGAHAFSFTPPRLDGQSGDDQLLGSGSDDRLAGGSGVDVISGRDGADYVNSRDGVRDKVRCGAGRDRVVADRRDSVASDCERVSRG